MATNRRPDWCSKCGRRVEAGQGVLYRCLGMSTGCYEHYEMEIGAWHVDCADRAACDNRVAEQRRAAEAARARREAHRALVRELRDRFDNADHPRGPSGESLLLEGEEIVVWAGDQRIYGGGVWVVVEPAERGPERGIWLVEGNGADGDDWSQNNVRTGGAGAIGLRLPWTPELEDLARRAEEGCSDAHR